MKRNIINGIEYTKMSGYYASMGESEKYRRNGVYIHELKDASRDSDYFVLDCDIPKDSEEADMLPYLWETYSSKSIDIDTVKYI